MYKTRKIVGMYSYIPRSIIMYNLEYFHAYPPHSIIAHSTPYSSIGSALQSLITDLSDRTTNKDRRFFKGYQLYRYIFKKIEWTSPGSQGKLLEHIHRLLEMSD